MSKNCVFILVVSLLVSCLHGSEAIQLHPDNPHYFLWQGRPTILISSAEHYGAVLNPDFDTSKYLKTLAADGLNYTRMFVGGTYVEPLGAFNIPRNTLAPKGDRFLSPWARSDQPGYAGGGAKFDLTQWDTAYFARLKDFVSQAETLGIVVEVTLFCPFYGDSQWALSPLHASNNVNQTPEIDRTHVYTLDKHKGLLVYQERLTRKLVIELRDAGNVIFELCNEPYFGGVTVDWQHHIADVITETQKDHPDKKLIAQNIANKGALVTNPHAAVSILNFHYAAPPDTVAQNYALNRVIGDDETGFRGIEDRPYRMEGWDFIMAGGGLYNNLDYSFVAGHEDGTFVVPTGAPGGGNAGFRRSMRALQDFMIRFDFIHMSPDNRVIADTLPEGMSARALVTRGQAYAIYLHTTSKDEVQFEAGQVKIKLNLPAGQYQADWVDTRTGQAAASDIFRHETGACTLTAPAFTDDIGLAIQGLPKVLAYLKGISGKKIVAGQHNREPNADPDKWTQEIFATTHKSPGLWSGDFLFQADNIAHRQTMIDEAIRQWKSGAMINIMLHTCPPTQEEPCQWDPGVINQLLSDAQWKELVTDGTELNKNWKVRLDTIAPYLQQLKDAGAEVMFRPLHEMNQKVFWWGGRPGPNGTARLFRITHDYLTHIKGLDNLIWVWDMQDIDRTWAQYNPGEAYWDILAFDVYGNGYSQSWYEYAVSMAGDKPLAIGECSKLPTPAQLESQPRYVFFMPWAELVYRDNTPAQIIELYNSSRVMTLEELPLKPTE